MKTMNSTRLVSLTAACSLLLASGASAQETNEVLAPPNIPSKPAVPSEPAAAVSNQAGTRQTTRSDTHPMPLVLIGQNAELKADDTAEVVVVIGGSATIHGKVKEAVVAIGGNVEVDGTVGDAVVAVLGNVHLNPGAKVHSDAVAVMGTLSAAPGVTIGGDAVSVGGSLDVAPGAVIRGQKTSVVLPIPFVHSEWLSKWLRYCVFELRPLAPQVGFIWLIAGVYFLLYLFIAAAFPHPVQVTVDTLTRRPATTFLIGVLTKLLIPLVFLILLMTGVGLLVIPFLIAALFLGAAFGKVAILEWIGFRVGGQLGSGTLQKPLAAFLIGTVIITLLYMVPVLGLLVYTILAVWGLGCAVTAMFSSVRREAPEKPLAPPPVQGMPAAGAMAAVAPAQAPPGLNTNPDVPPVWPPSVAPTDPGASNASTAPAENAPSAQPTPTAPPVAPPGLSEKLSYPKAGFWERMGAAFLDAVIVIIVGAYIGRLVDSPPFVLVVALAYFAGLWAWKGTTVGGVVLKLQVVRTDGRPVTFVVALVRALAAAFSAIMLFLGFLWIAWDRDKQGWHDKIAGTEVVRLPRSMPLVCI